MTAVDSPPEVAPEPAPQPARRNPLEGAALFFAVFLSGAVLLAVEIVSSRVLAPYFGNSLYVWGALIGVVLTGLAVGYWLGGALADRIPDVGLLLTVMALGALLVLTIPYVDEHVLGWIVDWDPGARLNPLLSAVILFGPASIVLAAVTPVAVRIAARSVLTLGRTAGRLFAVSTVGSIVGTFATAFVLIPELGSNQLLGYAACALLAGTALVAAARTLFVSAVAAAAAAIAIGVLADGLALEQGGRLSGAAVENFSPVYRLRGGSSGDVPDFKGEGVGVLFRKESAYHSIAVVQDESTRYLRFDSSFQSAMRRARPMETPFKYVDYFGLGLAYHPSARNVLFVGLGGGSAPKRFLRDFPHLRLQAVELDPVVRDVAYRWFHLPRHPRLRIAVEDGRSYLQNEERRWDVIALDAYYSDSIPFHLATREFLELVRERLAPGGVLLANVIGALRGPDSQLFRAFYRTYRSVFPSVAVHPVDFWRGPLDGVQNLIVVAGEGALPSRAFLQQRWRELRRRFPTAVDLRKAIARRYERLIPTEDVPVLTDDYAPTDALIIVD